MVLDSNSVVGIMGLFITIISSIILLSIFWFKMSTSLKSILYKVGIIMTKQARADEHHDLFFQKTEQIAETSKESSIRQQSLCLAHTDGLAKVLTEQRAQAIQQDNMRLLFDDIKQLTTNTNSAIQNNTAVLTELLVIIKERK